MSIEIVLSDETRTKCLGGAIACELAAGDAVLLDGPLGAGKTVLARAILRAACDDPALEVPSPTYTLRQDYGARVGPVAHFDLWRLDGPAALEEIGWHEARAGIVLVEWPDRLERVQPSGALRVTLSEAGDGLHARLDGWPGDRIARVGDALDR